mgnify:CR=1 FL=1
MPTKTSSDGLLTDSASFHGPVIIQPVGDHLATARLGPAVERFGDRVLAVPVRGLDELAAAVRRATDGIGEGSDRRFRGHLTIARMPRGTPPPRPDLPVEQHHAQLVRGGRQVEGLGRRRGGGDVQAVAAQIEAEGLLPGMIVRVSERTSDRVRFWSNGDEHLLAPIVAASISVQVLEEDPQVEVDQTAVYLDQLSVGQKGRVLQLMPRLRGAERRRLMDLGMLRDIQLIEAETAVGLTLVLPTLGIPEQVRAYLLNSLYHAIQPFGLKLKVMLDEMDDAGKQHFFAQAQAAWKADGDCAARRSGSCRCRFFCWPGFTAVIWPYRKPPSSRPHTSWWWRFSCTGKSGSASFPPLCGIPW